MAWGRGPATAVEEADPWLGKRPSAGIWLACELDEDGVSLMPGEAGIRVSASEAWHQEAPA